MKEKKLTEKQVVAAATNAPELSEDEVLLGDRVVKVVDLPYDDYVTFLAYLQPAVEAFAAKLGEAAGVELRGSALPVGDIIRHCCDALPQMALLVCKQTNPEMTIEEVKALGKTPFRLAGVVLKQVEHNKMIQEIGDFFVQVMVLLPRNQ